LRNAVCGVSGRGRVLSFSGVCCCCENRVFEPEIEPVVVCPRFTGLGMLPFEVGAAVVVRTRAALRASSGIPGRWLKGKLVMNGWWIASCGFSLRSGSHRRQRVMKSRKASSSDFNAWDRVFELGLLRRPLLLTVTRGFPTESKNNFFLVQRSTR
jgi:hypothetical protein